MKKTETAQHGQMQGTDSKTGANEALRNRKDPDWFMEDQTEELDLKKLEGVHRGFS